MNLSRPRDELSLDIVIAQAEYRAALVFDISRIKHKDILVGHDIRDRADETVPKFDSERRHLKFPSILPFPSGFRRAVPAHLRFFARVGS